MSLGSKIRELRTARGWSQARLAVEVNKSRVYITRLEGDEYKDPGSRVIAALAQVFGVTEETFFRAAGHAPPPENPALNSFSVWLHGQNPTPDDVQVIRQLAEAYMEKNKR